VAPGVIKTPRHAPERTPAIVEGRICLRTAGHLYCFGITQKK
jgi:hypothetical protein